MQLVTIFTALNAIDADLVFARLSAADFHPVISNALAATVNEGFVLAAGGIDVQVPEDEAADAREFLADPGKAPSA
jgi:hypothetical protein